MLAKRVVGAALRSQFHNLPCSLSKNSRPIISLRPTLRTAFFRSSSDSSVENNEDAPKFTLKKSDGKRFSGAEFFEEVKKVAVKEESEEFVVPKDAFEVLLSEYDTLLGESSEWKDKYQRSLAETENVRKRGMKQAEEAKVFAIQGFCKDLLEVADILDLAVNSVKKEQLESGDKNLVDLHKGVVMTKDVLLKTFQRHGLVQVNPMGEKFDPNLHEAVFQVPQGQGTEAEPGHIMHVAKVGYCLKERPIRAAQVGVVMDS
ncbi:unnamed protein product [Nippostrongylus brasiliensis]|uniref:GrpE protein homolog, mitochondrial (inferred by orthology to a C. elegans protein) n=1 Tax=Nippostrongylus brasiliensis TaxID=27835 RepID=A0A0N4Y8Z9_NIPBR|nr:hypothetical protein Q1695_014582 [Nippostrongylus brasiliensis]VDL76335.1 unnamed protein product [Nippostrongylus brasiliensis]